ncbi:hypothetical protein FRC01_002225 [Tulasnella sp. 417]|nr:hypothetical protein FRC01_002225 [Tulasnella sp. 417]
MDNIQPLGPVRTYSVALVPPPPVIQEQVPPPQGNDGEAIIMYIARRICKWLVDQLWIIVMILIGLLLHNYVLHLLQLSHEGSS